jgi:DeoR family transcriptional regulator, glycerol-3-phosphate regulon repressor
MWFCDYIVTDIVVTTTYAYLNSQKIMKSHKTSRRLNTILEHLRYHSTTTVTDLAVSLNVSEETIRRDAKILEAKGEISKLHGALALPHLTGEAPFEKRMREHYEIKRAIAKYATRYVADGDSIMIDTGTTTSIFAQELRVKRNLTIVTNSSDIARTLATVNGNTVYMAGGALKGDNGAAFGPSAVEFFSRFRVKHAFISIGALDAHDGPMDAELSEAEIAHMALARADHRVILSDASKFGKTALVKVCEFNLINRLVTNESPSSILATALADAGVIVDIVATP